jgi:hypothetical protein
VHFDDCTEAFITGETNRILGGIAAQTAALEDAIEAQTLALTQDAANRPRPWRTRSRRSRWR